MPDHPALKFAPKNVGHTIAGEETATVRVDLDDDVRDADMVELQTQNGVPYSRSLVQAVVDTKVGMVGEVLADYNANHPSESAEGLKFRLNGHYDADIRIGTDVTVVVLDHASILSYLGVDAKTALRERPGEVVANDRPMEP